MKKIISNKTYLLFIVLAVVISVTSRILIPTIVNAIDVGTGLNINNAAPSFSGNPYEDPAITSDNPVNIGSNVVFKGTSSDDNEDDFYLAICKTDSISANASSAPTCTGGAWCISTATTNETEATCSYATQSGDSESEAWYGFVCDHNADSSCSSSSQGSGDSGTPFEVNHYPSFTNATSGSADPGGTITFSSTASDSDSNGLQDEVKLVVCADTSGATVSGCTGTQLCTSLGSPYAPDTSLAYSDASYWGEDSADLAGYSVSDAGNVNGDDYDDFIIGARNDSDVGTYSGQTYLILGKSSGWTMDVDLGNADASFRGGATGDYAGHCVSGVGDVDNDGYDDFLIGAFGEDDGGSYAGQTYLVLGKDSGWSMDVSLDSNADASFWGENSYDKSGESVSGVGNVNGDDYDDFIIGAEDAEGGGTYRGETYLMLGRATGSWSQDMDLSNASASFEGEADNDRAGSEIAGIGDVNDDGYDDFAIGSARYSSFTGQVYIIFGKSSGWSMNVDLSNADASLIGEHLSNNAGKYISGAGDVNNDGYDDLLVSGQTVVGESTLGIVYVIFGRATGSWSMDMDIGDTADASYLAEAVSDDAGKSTSGIGDINDDGYADFLIGADEDNTGGTNAGKTYLILGKGSGWSLDVDLGNSDASFIGESGGDYSGTSVSGAGDIDNDGYDDFLIGAPNDSDGGSTAGQAYMIKGEEGNGFYLSDPSCTYTIPSVYPDDDYNYYAYIFDSHEFGSDDNYRSGTYTVNNVDPAISNVTLNGGSNITLTNPGPTGYTNITLTADVTDNNSCGDISSVQGYLYRSAVTYSGCDSGGEADNNNCYPEVSCSVDSGTDDCTGSTDASAAYTCTAAVYYHADPTDGSTATDSTWYDQNWLDTIKVTDDDAVTDSDEVSTGVEMSSYTAFSVTSSINYGSLETGTNTDTTNQSTSISATGNVGLDENISGTTMTFSTYTIPISNQKYSLTTFDYDLAGTALSDSAVESELDCAKTTVTGSPVSDPTHWGIAIPAVAGLGSYTGTNYIVAIKGEAENWKEVQDTAVSEWKLNDNDDNSSVADSLGSNDGTYTGGSGGTDSYTSTHNTTGIVNDALTFDGNDYITVADPVDGSLDFGTSDFTSQAWIKTSTSGYILTKQSITYPIYPSYRMGVNDGHAMCICYNSGQNAVIGTVNVADGNWHMITCSREISGSDSIMSVYVDGELDESQTFGTIRDVSSTYPLRIGVQEYMSGYFTGIIDDVRIYSYSLDLDDVQYVYNGGNGRD